MKKILAIMPLMDGHVISHRVLASLAHQEGADNHPPLADDYSPLQIALMPLSRPLSEYTEADYGPLASRRTILKPRRKGVTENRNLLARLCGSNRFRDIDYVLHIDGTTVLEGRRDVYDMSEALNAEPGTAAIGIRVMARPAGAQNAGIPSFGPERNHVDMACILIRRSVLIEYIFHNGEHHALCNCRAFFDDMKAKGLTVRYLDDRIIPEDMYYWPA